MQIVILAFRVDMNEQAIADRMAEVALKSATDECCCGIADYASRKAIPLTGAKAIVISGSNDEKDGVLKAKLLELLIKLR